MPTFRIKYAIRSHNMVEVNAIDEFGAAEQVEKSIAGAEVYSVQELK